MFGRIQLLHMREYITEIQFIIFQANADIGLSAAGIDWFASIRTTQIEVSLSRTLSILGAAGGSGLTNINLRYRKRY